jgi:hypothetical protein
MNNLQQIQQLIDNISLSDLAKVANIIELRKLRETENWLDNLPEENEEISPEEELEVEAILDSINNGETTFSWEEVKLQIGIEDDVETGI